MTWTDRERLYAMRRMLSLLEELYAYKYQYPLHEQFLRRLAGMPD